MESQDATAIAPGPLMVAEVDGGSARRLLDPTADVPAADDCLWSSDGRTLYFKAHDAKGSASFWAVSAEGGTPRLIVRFDEADRQSASKDFGLDARRFYFAIEDRQSDVFVAEAVQE